MAGENTTQLGNQDVSAQLSNDVADFLMSSLFGAGWQNVVTAGEGGSYTTSLFAMFELFNSTVLAGVGFLITWTIVAGIAGAAYEGRSFGDKNGNLSLWTPSRMAYAVGILAPLPGIGLSALQAVILALSMTSVTLANNLVTSVIDVMTGSPVTGALKTDSVATSGQQVRPLILDMMSNDFREDIKDMFTLSMGINMPNDKKLNGTVVRKDSFVDEEAVGNPEDLNYTGASKVTWKYLAHDGTDVGFFELKCSPLDGTLGNNSFCASKAAVYDKAINQVNAITVSIKNDHVDKNFAEKSVDCPIAGGKKTPTECYVAKLTSVGTNMLSGIGTVISKELNGNNSKTGWKSEVDSLKKSIQSGGFMLLGSYYLRINQLNEMINESLKTKTTSLYSQDKAAEAVKEISGSLVTEENAGVQGKGIDISDRLAFSGQKAMMDRLEGGAQEKPESFFLNMWRAHYLGTVASSKMITLILAGNEPISQLQNIGLGLITATDGWILGVSAFRATAISTKETAKGLADSARAAPFGLGVALGAAAESANFFVRMAYHMSDQYFNLLSMWTNTIVSVLTLMMFFLAYYLPALPAILWLLAILGFLILVIEAVVAAPVWAAAHAIPEGEGIAGQHGKQGYMMLMNILLRPSLMVIGFFFSMALIWSFSMFSVYLMQNTLISNLEAKEGFENVVSSGFFFSFIMSFVSGIVLVGGTLIVVIHKSLNLVTWLPENVIKWAGGHGSSLGDQSDERRVAALIGSVGNTARPMGGTPKGGTEPEGGKDDKTPGTPGTPGGGKKDDNKANEISRQ